MGQIKIPSTLATKGTPGIQFTKGVGKRSEIIPANGVISGVVKGGADTLEGVNPDSYTDMFPAKANGLALIDITVKALPGGDANVWGRNGQDPDKDLVWFSIREGSTQVKLWNSIHDRDEANLVQGKNGMEIAPRYVTVPLMTIEYNPREKVIYSDNIPGVASAANENRGTVNRSPFRMGGHHFNVNSLKYMGVKMTNKRNSWIYHHVFQWRQVWMVNKFKSTKDRMYWKDSILDENRNPDTVHVYPESSFQFIR